MRIKTRALTFSIAYSMLHKISSRMSGRSSLCDLWFAQTLRHKFDLYIYLSIWEPLTTADSTANVSTADVTTANVTPADVLGSGLGLGLGLGLGIRVRC